MTATPPPNDVWSAAEIEILRDLWLGNLPPPPPEPGNAVADDPRAAALGHRLFFESRLSANLQISCATCHIPEFHFTDRQPVAHGTRPNHRHTMSLLGVAYAPWLLWDGHKDSLWAQAIEPIEAADEQGATRLHALHLINQESEYRTVYSELFGPLPDVSDTTRFPYAGGPVEHPPYRRAWEQMDPADQAAATQVVVNLGKAIAAYERLLLPGPGRFDSYISAVLAGDRKSMEETLTAEEVAGLRLFIGPANCVRCHNGPLFTDHNFHNTGVPFGAALPEDEGRKTGLARVLADEFNCLSPYSEAGETACQALRSINNDDPALLYAFRAPGLRHVAETGPYMHAGQFTSLDQVLSHYNRAPAAPLGDSDLQPLDLSEAELDQLEAFLRTLSGPPVTPDALFKPPGE